MRSSRGVGDGWIAALHDPRGLTELEEGWLVGALYREHRLLQPAIAQRMGRHKSLGTPGSADLALAG